MEEGRAPALLLSNLPQSACNGLYMLDVENPGANQGSSFTSQII